ncbi:Acidic ribosomal protein P0 [Halorhabdus tiamatea SARL4B]|uniref:Large ribosomal subunit protein uL10 n=1 Tax=Halorhabdus tiamatea SARL4B TaxID=1033806 RepID=F7PN45_9EURY|nr:50S ribosomal protein L10 [Halorhabdus tiamatea]ERJ07759.1 Acidic ribosomal protein P0 [Halorhabdus tiamatea SARL4B]CCQ32582.1 50S ribosomal protein P0 (L10p) [Halorhabdus tiamatea SARL4B]
MSAESERKTEHIPEWKREEIDDVVEMIESYDSVGVVDLTGIPSQQLQDMRRNLYGTAELRVSRNTLVERALDEVDEGLETLVEFVSGHVGLIGTNDNPFSLYQQLEASKTSAPINAGEVAPNDIVIPEGDTGIDPGPFVGELQSVGANARIQEGSIQVLEDSTVLEAGGEVSADLSNVLAELGIEPKEVGLDLRAVYAEGVLFEPEDLELDIEAYRSDVQAAAGRARNLSINAVYPTAETGPALLQKARGEAKSLGVQASIESPDLADDLVSKADAQVRALVGQIDDEAALPEELQGVETDTASEEATAEQADDQAEDDVEDTTDDADDAEDGDDDEDGGDGGDALGAMFD